MTDTPNNEIDVQTKANICANCREKINPCACMRNKCLSCGQPVGNITFTVCDDCWDTRMAWEEEAGSEEDLTVWP